MKVKLFDFWVLKQFSRLCTSFGAVSYTEIYQENLLIVILGYD